MHDGMKAPLGVDLANPRCVVEEYGLLYFPDRVWPSPRGLRGFLFRQAARLKGQRQGKRSCAESIHKLYASR